MGRGYFEFDILAVRVLGLRLLPFLEDDFLVADILVAGETIDYAIFLMLLFHCYYFLFILDIHHAVTPPLSSFPRIIVYELYYCAPSNNYHLFTCRIICLVIEV